VVWTAGVKPHPVVGRLGLPLEQGRIVVDETLKVRGVEGVWAIGDAATPGPASDRIAGLVRRPRLPLRRIRPASVPLRAALSSAPS